MEYYRQYHSLLFSIAYRMLGSFQDAEDIIQELFADLQEKDIGHSSIFNEINHKPLHK
ncbi:sigma factor [Bacillus licheniformis]|uniref:sigma factor n=1 Tax=Bacillus licheniformis TaxID=1402 RepID=UPI001320DF72|nr:sigma factor [Bacillus licheniformis]TWL82566.1 hypothetical protein CHCC15291_3429 [Bacillus licheniformis]TWL99189.1 hypothetical protein CHCC15289_4627 [Bacillus licheniformis]